jgi:hypothetical protein
MCQYKFILKNSSNLNNQLDNKSLGFKRISLANKKMSGTIISICQKVNLDYF